jgi:hypothetical protein
MAGLAVFLGPCVGLVVTVVTFRAPWLSAPCFYALGGALVVTGARPRTCGTWPNGFYALGGLVITVRRAALRRPPRRVVSMPLMAGWSLRTMVSQIVPDGNCLMP